MPNMSTSWRHQDCLKGGTTVFLPSLPKKSSLLNLFKAFPQTSKPLIEFHEVLLRGPSPFTEAERELIATYVSGLNQCRYCRGVHSATAENLGVPADVVDNAIDDVETAPVDEKMRPVLRYAKKLTKQPSSVTQVDADAIFAAGWDETALYHTVAVTALFNFMNRLVEGMGIELDPVYVKPASERLAKHEYLPLLDMIQTGQSQIGSERTLK
jgi:uncharacterized peroxidase-related enzyme